MKRLTKYLAMFGVVAALSASKPAAAADSMWFNMKLGPSIGASNAVTQFALQFEFAYKLIPNGYLLVPFQMQFGNGVTSLGFPLGFQYDIAIPGVKGLFLYPRLAIGYGLFVPSGADAQHAFLLIPGFGVKYVLKERWQFGFEPFELPVGIGNATGVSYRLNFYAGMRF